jgi:hypothetical protein
MKQGHTVIPLRRLTAHHKLLTEKNDRYEKPVFAEDIKPVTDAQ